IEKKQMTTDSGGPGQYRGGCGQETTVRFVQEISAVCDPGPDRSKYPARGSYGGQPGAPGSLRLNAEPIFGKKMVSIRNGDRLISATPGGGGFGDPLQRDPARVLEDVLDDLVSLEQATSTYGVVLDTAKRSVDAERTAELRRTRRS
ncbi:MAG: hydantoinase B/oxoprolinase family protein, partial [Dehalococcoidia bacterium]|nr:hydantoinase B/oxoprolinase family protein [Dehalococcoidia bacterium]